MNCVPMFILLLPGEMKGFRAFPIKNSRSVFKSSLADNNWNAGREIAATDSGEARFTYCSFHSVPTSRTLAMCFVEKELVAVFVLC